MDTLAVLLGGSGPKKKSTAITSLNWDRKTPKEAMRIELVPGSYKVEWKTKSGKSATEYLELEANTTWCAI